MTDQVGGPFRTLNQAECALFKYTFRIFKRIEIYIIGALKGDVDNPGQVCPISSSKANELKSAAKSMS